MKRVLSASCPDCGHVVSQTARVRLEFFGGEIVCGGCAAVLHLDHRWWWLGFTIIGCEGTLLIAFAAVLLTMAIGWWSIVALFAVFVLLGLLVALTSPLKVVDRGDASGDQSPVSDSHPARVKLVSHWGVNPYQKLLVRELRALGIVVSEEVPTIAGLQFRDGHDILHLQNVRPYLTARGTIVSAIRVTGFVARLLISRGAGQRIVWTAHDLQYPNGTHRLLDAFVTAAIGRISHRVIVHSDGARARLSAAAHLSARKVEVIRHPSYVGYYQDATAPREARAKLGVDDSAFVFLLFGWVRRYKGVAELIHAFKTLAASTARLIVAGRVPDAAFDAELRRDAASDGRIMLHLQSVADQEVQTYFRASDAVVLPYTPVLTSGAAVLAQSFAKPCIVARHSGIDEDFDGDGAFFYDPTVQGSLQEALERAMANRDRMPAMGGHNHVLASTRTWHDAAAATVRLYTSLLQPRPEE